MDVHPTTFRLRAADDSRYGLGLGSIVDRPIPTPPAALIPMSSNTSEPSPSSPDAMGCTSGGHGWRGVLKVRLRGIGGREF